MSALSHLPPLRTLLLAVLGIECAILASFVTLPTDPSDMTATLFLRKPQVATKWIVFIPEEVRNGVTVPADTNVVFSLPENTPPIQRETLLGHRGKSVRYWGYCYPDDGYPETQTQTVGFPGRMFLSERERDARVRSYVSPTYTRSAPPTRTQLDRDAFLEQQHGLIRHQIEVFSGGQTCYVMTASALSLGIDEDNDGLNSQEEKTAKTDPENPDTDSDGATDGDEILSLFTDPINPDTDHDGLPDGMEVHGHSTVQPGDTDPLNPDSDHDGLCDGLCPVSRNRQFCLQAGTSATLTCTGTDRRWAGEDKNLNGQLDASETDPLKWSTKGDGISDLQQYYNCLLRGGSNC